MVKPRMIIESHVPYVPAEIEEYFRVERLSPEEISRESVKDAEVLIVRTRTRCDASLLRGSNVRVVATATIGTDHIDKAWCAANGIAVCSAPGCNAPAVAQYVMASLLSIYPEGLSGKAIGVVGVGHVGSIVADWAAQLGMRVLKCDPPRAESEPGFESIPLDQMAPQVDVMTLHVPHTTVGEYATHHMVNGEMLRKLRRGAVLINSARGPIVDTADVIVALENGTIGDAVIDCWEGEPTISLRLLQLATIATPHIAGYSLNGKIRATAMVINAICEAYGIGYRMRPHIPAGAAERVTAAAIVMSYDPLRDTAMLREAACYPDFATRFEALRNGYHLRREVGE